MKKRIFLIVLDSFGIGAMPDAALWGDVGSNTLRGASQAAGFAVPTMCSLGLGNIEGVSAVPAAARPIGAYGRMAESSRGKDTTVGHWEIAGVISPKPFPTYPHGFPEVVIRAFSEATGRSVLCNKPYSGTQVIADYGQEHCRTGKLIVYTSADSVFQIAAHEDVVSVPQLYEYCRIARRILTGEHGVGRVIARPFTGQWPYTRTANRHDFSLVPPTTMLNVLQDNGFDTISVGKIVDIFAESGITSAIRTHNNDEGMTVTQSLATQDFCGLCFVNLVDTDMVYGHRRDVQGYGDALGRFDKWLAGFLPRLRSDDMLIITADHGCDPSFSGTDHTREYVPLLLYGQGLSPVNVGTRGTFADVACTVLSNFGLPSATGQSMLPLLL